jgi:hypothetical protein
VVTGASPSPERSSAEGASAVRVTPVGSVSSGLLGGSTAWDPMSDSHETGTGRLDRNQADAISSKIGVVSPRSKALAPGS